MAAEPFLVRESERPDGWRFRVYHHLTTGHYEEVFLAQGEELEWDGKQLRLQTIRCSTVRMAPPPKPPPTAKVIPMWPEHAPASKPKPAEKPKPQTGLLFK